MKSEQFKLYDKGNAFELRVPFLLGSIARFSSDSALCSFCVHSCSIQFIHELSCFSNFWFEMFRELVICSANKISQMQGWTPATSLSPPAVVVAAATATGAARPRCAHHRGAAAACRPFLWVLNSLLLTVGVPGHLRRLHRPPWGPTSSPTVASPRTRRRIKCSASS